MSSRGKDEETMLFWNLVLNEARDPNGFERKVWGDLVYGSGFRTRPDSVTTQKIHLADPQIPMGEVLPSTW